MRKRICGKRAEYKLTLFGRKDFRACRECSIKLKGVMEAMGCHLQLIEIGHLKHVELCHQIIGEDS